MSWWVLTPLLVVLCALLFVGMMAALHEMNPDPGWRAREAEIRRLSQEEELRRLREARKG